MIPSGSSAPLASHILAERVPRYTSYPTAPHFTAEIGPGAYADWLEQVPYSSSLSLYIHVPFCRELCLYCGCHTKAMRRQAPLDAYAADLIGEIGLVAGHLGAHRVSHLHWGGGTPSALEGRNIARVAERLDAAFGLGGLREHAIEMDPRHLDAGLVRDLARVGVNRVSLGVQDFSPHVQQAIGRIQPYDQVARAVGMLREAGIASLNFDLMYGLPGQTVADVVRSAELAVRLAPDRIALFGYAHVPWFRPQQRLIDARSLPDPSGRLAQMSAARTVFIAAGFRPIGLDHFALPDDALAVAARAHALRRNFQGYTCDPAETLIGFGASAIGRLPQGFVQNAADVGGYRRAIAGGRLATARGIELTSDDRVRGRIIERLMCDLAAEPRAIAADFGLDRQFADELAAMGPYVEEGLVQHVDGRLAVTEKGRPVVRLIAAVFDSRLNTGARRHSMAV